MNKNFYGQILLYVILEIKFVLPHLNNYIHFWLQMKLVPTYLDKNSSF